jgi:N-methylhydantoinase A/oxoprolinase/acetone carboxylase beta subunit
VAHWFTGPACYKLGGTEPTLTDAYLVLGYLDEHYFLGGQKNVSKDAAQTTIENKLVKLLGISYFEAALAIVNNAVQTLGRAILDHLTTAHVPVADASLAAIGGGGGCIGALVAGFLGIRETYVFRQGGVFGAYGTSGIDIVHLYDSRLDLPSFLDSSQWTQNCRLLNMAVAALQQSASNDMRGEGLMPEEVHFESELEFWDPTSGNPFRITLANPFLWPTKDRSTIMDLVFKRIGKIGRVQRKEISLSRLFLRAVANVPHSDIFAVHPVDDSESAFKGYRSLYIGNDRWVNSKIYEWDLLAVPTVLNGPAIIESTDTTVLIPPEMTINMDEQRNGVIGRFE